MDWKGFLYDQWQAIGGISALSGLALWFSNKKKRKIEGNKLNIDSADIMLEQIEKLNMKLTELFSKQVSDAQINAEQSMIINRLKIECPDCVGRILQIIEDEKGTQETS